MLVTAQGGLFKRQGVGAACSGTSADNHLRPLSSVPQNETRWISSILLLVQCTPTDWYSVGCYSSCTQQKSSVCLVAKDLLRSIFPLGQRSVVVQCPSKIGGLNSQSSWVVSSFLTALNDLRSITLPDICLTDFSEKKFIGNPTIPLSIPPFPVQNLTLL